MFSRAETVSLFGLTAVQAAVIAVLLERYFQFREVVSLPIGLISGFIISCVELYCIIKVFSRWFL